MKIIIKAVPIRAHCIKYLREALPQAEFCFDRKLDAFDTFQRSLVLAGDESCLHLEDDIILCENFISKAKSVINDKPDSLIQFFSMRQKDKTIGSRWDRNFLMNQCFYAPKNYSKLMLDFSHEWYEKNKIENPTGTDSMVRDFLKSRKEKYWLSVPSLVQHRTEKSVINPKRSTKRQSITFRYKD